METPPPPILITEPPQLQDLISRLSREPTVAVDTESNSLFAYRERVCLIQFSIPDQDYLLDPLALNDISILGPILSDPDIQKIFHAAEYDILTLRRDFAFKFNNLFDTMVASRILGRKKVGLGNMLAAEFDVKVQKKFQKANWGKRPMPPDMLNYARLDTHYLIRLRDILRGELEQTNRLPVAEEDFARLCQLNGDGPAPQPTEIWRMNGARDLTPMQATTLKLLADYRRGIAEKVDRPLFKVIGDKTLVEIAAVEPISKNALRKINGMSEPQIHRHSRAILAAVRDGALGEPTHCPRPKRLDQAVADRLEALRVWRKKTAMGLEVESDVVLPKDVMLALAHEGKPAFPEAMKSIPWRLERFGPAIEKVLAKH
jgi:ribonuclease D